MITIQKGDLRLTGFLWIKQSILMLLTTGLISCAFSNNNDLLRYIHEVYKRPALAIEPIPKFEVEIKFQYPDITRRSPFKPIVMQKDTEAFAPNTNRPKQPLEAFPLDALKFVGVLKEGPTIWGLMRQPSGLVSRVKPGDYMGKNYGQIIKITNDKLFIEEKMQVNGIWEKKELTLNLTAPKQ